MKTLIMATVVCFIALLGKTPVLGSVLHPSQGAGPAKKWSAWTLLVPGIPTEGIVEGPRMN